MNQCYFHEAEVTPEPEEEPDITPEESIEG